MVASLQNRWWLSWAGPGAALITVLMLLLGNLTPFENLSADLRFHLRGRRISTAPIVLIAIDERSVAKLGHLPWSRAYLARGLQHLQKAAVVGIDLLLSEATPDDKQLAQAMANQGRVITANVLVANRSRLQPVEALKSVSAATGDISAGIDVDGESRSIQLVQSDGEETLGVSVVRLYASQRGLPQPKFQERLWLNWIGPVSTIPTISFIDLLEGKVPVDQIADKIVLIGTTAVGVDERVTPYDRQASGIHLHWTVAENLLSHQEIHILPTWWVLGIVITLGLGLDCLLQGHSGQWQLASVGIVAALWLVVVQGACFFNWSLPVTSPLLTLGLVACFLLFEGEQRARHLLDRQLERLWLENALFQETTAHKAERLGAFVDQLNRDRIAQQAIADSLITGLIAADAQGKIYFQNPASWLLFGGKDPAETLCDYLVNLEWITLADWENLYDTVIHKGEAVEKKVNFGKQTYLLQCIPIGQKNGILALCEDITDSVESQELRLTVTRMLSHEIRSPLWTIQGYAELLQESLPSAIREQTQEHLAPILTATERIDLLLTDLLSLVQSDTPTFSLQLKTFPVKDHIQRVVSQLLPQAWQKQVQIQVDLPSQATEVWADSLRFEQVLTNLLSNALKYGSNGQTISLRSYIKTDHIRIEVSDRGFGIAPVDLEQIWKTNYRIKSDQTQNVPGSGLGLSICKQLIQLMGGEIGVESEIGNGSTFWFTLPLATPQQVLPESPKVCTEIGTILLAEDNLVNQKIALRQLSKLGYTVDVVTNGLEAIEAFHKKQYALILMDCMMPYMDGFEAVRAIRELETEGKHIPIIALSAGITAIERENCFKAGMDAFLAKPVKNQELAAVLAAWLDPVETKV